MKEYSIYDIKRKTLAYWEEQGVPFNSKAYRAIAEVFDECAIVGFKTIKEIYINIYNDNQVAINNTDGYTVEDSKLRPGSFSYFNKNGFRLGDNQEDTREQIELNIKELKEIEEGLVNDHVWDYFEILKGYEKRLEDEDYYVLLDTRNL